MKQKLLIPTAFLLFLISSCDNDDNIPPDATGKVRYITEDITSATTWYADTVYVIDNPDFYVEATLTIQAGTVIKFQPGDAEYLGLGSGGTIIADGTPTLPIIFTSYKDDNFGGDTNNDGSASVPSPADWDHINLNGENGSVFDNCKFFYGGNGSYTYTLTLYGTENTSVTNCTFVNNRGGKFGDFYYGALDATDAGTGTVITGNTFYLNNIPLSISMSFNLDNSNVFRNPANQSETNTMNGIFTYAISDIESALSWAEDEVAFVINDNDLWIEANCSLTLADNVVLKFTSESEIVVDNNADIIQGVNVSFTSFKDDAKKGDTNGDGSATTPADNDWTGIFDNSLATPDPYYFTWPNIFYDSY